MFISCDSFLPLGYQIQHHKLRLWRKSFGCCGVLWLLVNKQTTQQQPHSKQQIIQMARIIVILLNGFIMRFRANIIVQHSVVYIQWSPPTIKYSPLSMHKMMRHKIKTAISDIVLVMNKPTRLSLVQQIYTKVNYNEKPTTLNDLTKILFRVIKLRKLCRQKIVYTNNKNNF